VSPVPRNASAGAYLRLIRFDRPIGSFLLLWPTWWGLWFAAGGAPSAENLLVFTAGVFLMRSAGCIVNDFADRHIDRHVQRTRERPLTSGEIAPHDALVFAALLAVLAFGLVLLTNPLTVWLSFGGLALACIYPFMKRFTHLPQFGLGLAFSWGIPMAFAAERGALTPALWLVFLAAVLWSVVYDTFYAMVDRDDDLRIGVRSTAILFGGADRTITATLQVMVLALLALAGTAFGMGLAYGAALGASALLFGWQQWLLRSRRREDCFRAFLNNNLVGLMVFVGIAVDYALR
jgi:4-hydroxybenzoate polyprenyltransferase